MVKWVTLPNGVIHYNMSLSTTNILIVLLLFSYCSPIVLLLGKRKQYGIERRMNEERSKDERRMNEERYCRIVGRTAIKFHC